MEMWEHQKEAVKRAVEAGSFGFFFEMGTGKTRAAIETLTRLYEKNGKIIKTLILAPPIVLDNWKEEFAKYSDIPVHKIHVLNGSGVRRAKAFSNILDKNCIVITNYETLSMKVYNSFLRWAPKAIVFDESHKCKAIGAIRTKKSIVLADKADHKFLLTGTPFLNSLTDFFAQFRLLDGGASFGKNFFMFRKKYFHDRNAFMPKQKHFPDWTPNSDAEEKIKALVAKKSLHVKKQDCLDLPPLVRIKVPVEMTPTQKQKYDEMKKDFITFANGSACVAELAVTKALRLQQIVSGFIPVVDENAERKIVPIAYNNRAKALKAMLRDKSEESKIIVWAVFKENYEAIRSVCASLSLPYVECHGGISAKGKKEAVDAFNNNEKVRVFIGHPGSGGIGINLIASDVTIFYSRSFSLEYDLQAEARNYRGGSQIHRKITRYDLYTPGSIDEQVLESLAKKEQIGFSILKRFIKKDGT